MHNYNIIIIDKEARLPYIGMEAIPWVPEVIFSAAKPHQQGAKLRASLTLISLPIWRKNNLWHPGYGSKGFTTYFQGLQKDR